jgi:hypothetical protein
MKIETIIELYNNKNIIFYTTTLNNVTYKILIFNDTTINYNIIPNKSIHDDIHIFT